jgi:hypothetical protein
MPRSGLLPGMEGLGLIVAAGPALVMMIVAAIVMWALYRTVD